MIEGACSKWSSGRHHRTTQAAHRGRLAAARDVLAETGAIFEHLLDVSPPTGVQRTFLDEVRTTDTPALDAKVFGST